MGNCFGRRKQLVHPSDSYHQSHGPNVPSHHPSCDVRIKIRMTAAQFKELVSQADLSKGDGEISRLIVEECLKGTCHPQLITRLESKTDHGKVRSLEPIAEEE